MTVAIRVGEGVMTNRKSQTGDPHAALEQVLIDEYLDARGHSRRSLRELPEAESVRLLRAACDYASLRLAEIQSRAHYMDEIHQTS